MQLRDAFGHLDARWLVPAVALSLLIQVFRAWRWQLELRPLATSLRHALGGGERRLHGDQPAAGPDGRGRATLAAVAPLARQLLERRRQPDHREDLRLGGDRVLHPARPAHDARTCRIWVRTRRHRAGRGVRRPAPSLVVLLWWRGEQFVEGRLVRWLPERVGPRVVGVARSLRRRHARARRSAPRRSRCSLVSLLLWFLPILSSWVMIQAFHIDAPFNAALAVFILIGFGTALPQLPGMVGHVPARLRAGRSGSSACRRPQALAYGIVLNARPARDAGGAGAGGAAAGRRVAARSRPRAVPTTRPADAATAQTAAPVAAAAGAV